MQYSITCPNCKTKIPLDESEYEHLLSEVRNEQFDKEVNLYKSQVETQKQAEIDLAVSKEKENFAKKESEYKSKIANYEATIKAAEDDVKLKIDEAVAKADKDHAIALSVAEKQILELQAQIKTSETESELAIEKATKEANEKVIELNQKLQMAEKDKQLEISQLKLNHEFEIKLRDDRIEQISNYKKSLSTKMLGESLEQHCNIEYEKVRPYCFPNATFGKDNVVIENTKGDFVFRDYTDDGIEIISILFEMKNQDEDTQKKHKNEEFFPKLDSDRKKKKCEYAILVSMLEEDSELYNMGIVDISHRVPKAFVIRPQFFIPIIQILRKAAMESVDAKRELIELRNREIDLTHFEDNFRSAADLLLKQINFAQTNHNDAIEVFKSMRELADKGIALLERSNNQLSTSSNKLLNDFSVNQLAKNAPSIKTKLLEARDTKTKES